MENTMNNEIMEVAENTVAEVVESNGFSKADFGKGMLTGVVGSVLVYGGVKIGKQVFSKLKAKKAEKDQAKEAQKPKVEVDGETIEGKIVK